MDPRVLHTGQSAVSFAVFENMQRKGDVLKHTYRVCSKLML